jgi:hypothetical protein
MPNTFFPSTTIKTNGPIGTVVFEGPFISFFNPQQESLIGIFGKALNAAGVPVQPVNFYDPFHGRLSEHPSNLDHIHLLHQTLKPFTAQMIKDVCQKIPAYEARLVFGGAGCTGLVTALEKNAKAINDVNKDELSQWALQVVNAFLANPIDIETHDFPHAIEAFTLNFNSLSELCAKPSSLSEKSCLYFRQQIFLFALISVLLLAVPLLLFQVGLGKKRPSLFTCIKKKSPSAPTDSSVEKNGRHFKR